MAYIRKDGARLTVLRTITGLRGDTGVLEGFIGLASGMVGPVPEKGQRMLDIAVSNADRLVR